MIAQPHKDIVLWVGEVSLLSASARITSSVNGPLSASNEPRGRYRGTKTKDEWCQKHQSMSHITTAARHPVSLSPSSSNETRGSPPGTKGIAAQCYCVVDDERYHNHQRAAPHVTTAAARHPVFSPSKEPRGSSRTGIKTKGNTPQCTAA